MFSRSFALSPLRRLKTFSPSPSSPSSSSSIINSSSTSSCFSSASTAGWEAVIGLEIHSQILSSSKLFSDTKFSFNALPNTEVSLFDAATPGTLPVLNSACVEKVICTGIALNAQINLRSAFDRKHYFYGDLPAGYQITQHYSPVVVGGHLDLLTLDGLPADKRIRLEQVQLEQDTGKSHHDMNPDYTFIDLNRAGVGLMEIVTKPDFQSAVEAGVFLKKLQAILRAVKSSDGNMEEGSLRCDVNISVRKPGEPYGTRCEVKNLNSIKSVQNSIDYEIHRHIQILTDGQKVQQETRGYDVSKGVTFKLRSKEEARDYRYMPEPDLPDLVLDQELIDKCRDMVHRSGLPDIIRQRLMTQYNLNLAGCKVLMEEPGGVGYFEQAAKGRDVALVMSWITSELMGAIHQKGQTLETSSVPAQQLGTLIDLVSSSVITGRIGKDVLEAMVAGDNRPANVIVEEKGWRKMDDTSELENLIVELVKANPDRVAKIKQGKDKILGSLVGDIMKKTKGRADPQIVNELLKKEINKRP